MSIAPAQTSIRDSSHVSCPFVLGSPRALAQRPLSFFFSSRRRHTRSVSAFLLNRSSDLPVLQTPKATSSTLYFDSLTVNAGNGGFLHCIQMDTSVNAANQVVSVGADIAFDADPKFFACLV